MASLAWTMAGCHAPRARYDDGMSESATTEPPAGGEVPGDDPSVGTASSASSPGERRLAHPPSDRYREAEARAAEGAATSPDPGASVARGVALATFAAILGALAIVVLGGVIAISAGLVVIAGAAGWAVAAALGYGAGEHLSGRRRVVAAIGLSIAAVALGQLGVWQYARTEGGVLPLFEYLAEVFGPLVPIEFGAAAVIAWLTAR
jgi:hypothetical protein